MSPSGIFGIIAWPDCHAFRNVRSFYECCDKVLYVLIIDVCKIFSERHMAVFLGDFYV